MNCCRHFINIIPVFVLLCSCSLSRNFTREYYNQNIASIGEIKKSFEKIYAVQPFALEIKDKRYNIAGLEIITDSMKYVYTLNTRLASFRDTLQKFHLNPDEMETLLKAMEQAKATWINQRDYYERLQKKYLIFLSFRHKNPKTILKKEDYFTVVFFDQPQLFDRQGRLLDRADRRNRHMIAGEIFHRINDTTCYAMTGKFR